MVILWFALLAARLDARYPGTRICSRCSTRTGSGPSRTCNGNTPNVEVRQVRIPWWGFIVRRACKNDRWSADPAATYWSEGACMSEQTGPCPVQFDQLPGPAVGSPHPATMASYCRIEVAECPCRNICQIRSMSGPNVQSPTSEPLLLGGTIAVHCGASEVPTHRTSSRRTEPEPSLEATVNSALVEVALVQAVQVTAIITSCSFACQSSHSYA